MNARKPLTVMSVAAALLIGWGATRAGAQDTTAAAAASAARNDDFDLAVAAARGGDLVAALALLVRHNVQAPETMQWDIETATKLVNLAIVLRENYDFLHGNLAARQAIVQLSATLQKHATDAPRGQRAQACEIAGVIYEQLLVDLAAAKSAYQLAQQANPDSKAAATGLARIKKAEDDRSQLPGGRN